MRIRLLTKQTIEIFMFNHANGKHHFNTWLKIIKSVEWNEPKDITETMNGNLIGKGSNRVVFDIGGNGNNAFRIICSYFFGRENVNLYVNWIGTHEEYNRLSDEQKRAISKY